MMLLYIVIGMIGLALIVQSGIDLKLIYSYRALSKRIDELLEMDAPRPHYTPDHPLSVEQILLRIRGEGGTK